jgi:hypothetical protein
MVTCHRDVDLVTAGYQRHRAWHRAGIDARLKEILQTRHR